MKFYEVGGVVRDRLLGLATKDRDWVVVGASPQQMIEKGFQPIGKDFPVFLHPQTKEEYALARTERKKGTGYRGFVFYSEPDVSLEDDLRRRDLSINAMAFDPENQRLIDPYGGQEDIRARILRHTSAAFSEDPLRILRCARFWARFYSYGFKVAAKTQQLLTRMASTKEIETLSAERVWVETAKALEEKSPHKFFELLHHCGGLRHWYKELESLFGIPQPPQHHPEIDCGVHTLMVLEQTALGSQRLTTRFAALCHDLGKGKTPKKMLPSHHGHEERGVPLVESLCRRLRTPKEVGQLARLTCRYHTHIHRIGELKAKTILALFDAFDLWRRPERFSEFLMVCQADMRGRTGFEKMSYEQKDIAMRLAEAAQGVDIQQAIANVVEKDRASAVRSARLAQLEALVSN